MSRDSFVDPHSLLALVCHNKPLITTTGNELLRHIPFQRWDGSAGRKVPTIALLASVDNGNDAFKGHWRLPAGSNGCTESHGTSATFSGRTEVKQCAIDFRCVISPKKQSNWQR